MFHDLDSPVIFVGQPLEPPADTPTILRAIPRKWRSRTAVGAAADYFYKSRWKARLVALLFNTVPIARTGGGLGNGARDHVDKLIQERWNLLIFPEGTRSRDGHIGRRPLGCGRDRRANDVVLDIVPIYVHGTYTAMPPGAATGRSACPAVLLPAPPPQGQLRRRRSTGSTPTTGARSWPIRAFWSDQERAGGARPPEVDVLLMHQVLERRFAREADIVATASNRCTTM